MGSSESRPWNIRLSSSPVGNTFTEHDLHLLNPQSVNLGPWQFIYREAKSVANVGDYQVCECPNHAYIYPSDQSVLYFVDRACTRPTPTFSSVPDEEGANFFRIISQNIQQKQRNNPTGQILVGANISGYNHLGLQEVNSQTTADFCDDPTRKKLAQSVPFLHFHVISADSKVLDGLPKVLVHDPVKLDPMAFEQLQIRFSREMNIPINRLTPAVISQLLRLSIFDPFSFQTQAKVIGKNAADLQNDIVTNPHFRTPSRGQTPPYGLEFDIRADNLTDAFTNYPKAILTVLQNYERALIREFASRQDQENTRINPLIESNPLPSFNFTVTFLDTAAGVKMHISEHDMVRSAMLESMGIAVVRPNRGCT